MSAIRPIGNAADWMRLLRMDRPVGYWLLLWPTMWGLFAASSGRPEPINLLIFIAGVFLMRSAGCVINDYADRNFDPHVERTKMRPIAAGRIAPAAALLGFVAMLVVALLLVCQSSRLVIELSLIGALLASLYPFLKRVTHLPQAWLGMAFGWGAVMAWAAERGSLDSPVPWLLFAANLFWSLSYDTAYALGDRADDLKVGVKSTAILFGDQSITAIQLFALLMLLLVLMAAMQISDTALLGWMAAAAMQSWLVMRLRISGESGGFDYFLRSHWVGFIFLLGLLF